MAMRRGDGEADGATAEARGRNVFSSPGPAGRSRKNSRADFEIPASGQQLSPDGTPTRPDCAGSATRSRRPAVAARAPGKPGVLPDEVRRISGRRAAGYYDRWNW